MSQVVVIGAGQHGLSAALTLARAGRKVTLLEAAATPGGLCGRQTFAEGFAYPGLLRDEGLLEPAAWRRLTGLREQAPRPVAVPRPDGSRLVLTGHRATGLDEAESAKLAAWTALPKRVAPVVQRIMTEGPPRGGFSTLRKAIAVRRLGRDDLYELMRVMPMSVADWLNDSFEDPALAAALALPGLLGAFCGPRAPWSAGNLLLTAARRGPHLAGGPAAFVDAAVTAAQGASVEVVTEAPVARIVVERGAVRGVVLDSGDRIDAERVIATCDPKTALGKLVGAPRLPEALAEDQRRYRARGTTAHLALGLDGALAFADGELVDGLRLPATLDDLERAMDPLRHDRLGDRLALDVLVHRDDRSLCDEGRSVVSVLAHGVPTSLEGDDARRALRAIIVDAIAEVCPRLPEQVLAEELLTPADIAGRHRLSGGHLHHGEHAPDQLLFMRPSVDCAHYATPIAGLFLGGSGSHPGGGFTATAGRLAAEALLATR